MGEFREGWVTVIGEMVGEQALDPLVIGSV
jgi:hypothetical protein